MKPVVSAINPAQPMGLPAVYVEKITLLPLDPTTNIQRVRVHLSLQVICRPKPSSKHRAYKILGGSYRVFAAFCKDPATLMVLKTDSRAARITIKQVRGGPPEIKKHYLKPPHRTQKPKTFVLGSDNIAVISQTLVVEETLASSEEGNNLYFYAVAYGTDPNSLQKNGVEGKIRAMRVGIPACETILTKGASPMQTAAFRVNDQDTELLWPGPVHYHSDFGYMA